MKHKNINSYFKLDLIDFSKILSIDLWVYSNRNKKESFKSYSKNFSLIRFFLGTIKSCIFKKPKIKIAENKNPLIFFMSTSSRVDLDKQKKIFQDDKFTTSCVLWNTEKVIEIKSFFSCIILIFRSKDFWLKTLKKNNIYLFSYNGLYLFLILFRAFSEAIKVFPYISKHQILLSFGENRPAENLICQLANIHNIETYALEHGSGFYKENNEGYFWEQYPINIFLNSICKNILCWGKLSEGLYKKHTNAKTYVIGRSGLSKIKNIEEGVTILFQDEGYDFANDKLFEISKNLIKLGIPVSNWHKKDNLFYKKGPRRDGPLRKIVIGYNSTLILELGFLGLKIFVLKDSPLQIYLPKSLVIQEAEFIKKEFFKRNDYPHEVWKNFIECTDPETKKRIHQIIKVF